MVENFQKGALQKGALLEFGSSFMTQQPNVILFQFNPETLSHTWTQPESAKAKNDKMTGNPLAVKGFPGESFSFTIAMDANETLAEGRFVPQQLVQKSGIYSRLAALEMLVFPVSVKKGRKLMGSALLRKAAIRSGKQQIPAMRVPVVLFVWGHNRILPVRVTNLTISETLYDEALNPIHATAQLSLRVLTPDEMPVTDPLLKIARAVYEHSQNSRQKRATDNLVNAADSPFGILPIPIVPGGI